MAPLSIYYPFQELEFSDSKCFLTGELTQNKMTVLPQWVMDKYGFGKDSFETMDKLKSVAYNELKIPCSEKVKQAFEDLDLEVKTAFEVGYEAITALDSQKIFLWIGRIVYGTLFHEMAMEKKRYEKYNKEFGVSTFLKERFGLFHLMLQSLVVPMEFIGKKPWSITVVKLKFSEDIMNYRDDTVNLLFSLGVNGFGIIATLHDNEIVAEKQKEIIEKIGENVLHPIQFEELYARFHYASYLLQYQPEYRLEKLEDKIIIDALPMVENAQRPMFGFWDEDMFASVLAGYWEIYGYEKKKILKFPNPILSFLEDPYSKDFVVADKIKLPF
jgi:hypothetical protein